MRRYEHEPGRAASYAIHDGQEVSMELTKGLHPPGRHVC